jgi:general secretion pathway protein J
VKPELKSPPNAGFTLMEALLATLLMALILGMLATVTAQWMPNWNRGFLRLQRTQLLAAGLDRVVADLAAAEMISTGGPNSAPLFDGTELSVTFVRTAVGPNTSSGLDIVRIAEAREDAGPALVRSTLPFAPESTSQSGGRLFSNPVVLIHSPYRIVFSYAGPDHIWHDTWSGQVQLPRAIRVRVRDAASSRTLPVSTSTVIHAELSARCAVARIIEECPGLNAASHPRDAANPVGLGAGGLQVQ